MNGARRLLLTAAVLLVAASAAADVGPPIGIRLLGDPRPAINGENYAGELEITADLPVKLAGFRLEGEGWSGYAIEAPADIELAKDDRLPVRFSAVPRDADRPLAVVFEVGGRTFRQELDLSARHYREMTAPGPVAPVPASEPFTGLVPTVAPPEQVPVVTPAEGDSKYSITVHGRWVYTRSDGVIIGGDGCRVEIWDEDADGNDLLGTWYTDQQGNYSCTFDWSQAEGYPDLFAVFWAANSRVELRDATYHNIYGWGTSTTWNYSGTNLDLGWLQPGNESHLAGMHVFVNSQRTWRWHWTREGYDLPAFDAYWPDGTSGAWYWDSIIHISSGSQWGEATVTHELGHHWMDHFATIPAFDYCNGVCDASASDCGHCLWCWESGAISWIEGFPDWLGDIIPRTYLADYGVAARYPYDFEGLSTCGGSYHDPLLTEGFVAALLKDVGDSDQDSHGVYGSWSDALSIGTNELFDVADFDAPVNMQDFLDSFKARWPSYREGFWESAKNCGYETDVTPPNAVTGLTSTSHSTSGDSPDPTIDYAWTRAYDDASGIDGYGIFISSGPGMPSTVKDIEDVTHYTTPALAPGTYYFNIRAVDRAGRWSASYASYGPITIRVAEPADLQPYLATGWSHELVPRPAADAVSGNVPEPTSLAGNANSTYWNMYGRNTGESTTSSGIHCELIVDGVDLAGVSWGTIGAGVGYVAYNRGPLTVRGGRHTFEVFHDDLEAIPETDEVNNHWAHQWIWSPLTLTAGTPVSRPAPPDRDAGWGSIVDGSTYTYNSDGLRFTSSGWWNVVSLQAPVTTHDYDLRLHEASTGPTNGFYTTLATSTWVGGYLDGVLVNRNVAGMHSYDVGVVNYNNGTSDYSAVLTQSTAIALGDSVIVPLAVEGMLHVRELYVATVDTGWVTVTVQGDPDEGPLRLCWYDRTVSYSSLGGATASLYTDADGRARLLRHVTVAGYYGIVVYRNPKDGTAARSFLLEVEKTLPDIEPLSLAGWHAPLTPRPAYDGTPASVAAPDTLYGNASATWYNTAIWNNSPVYATSDRKHFYVDGAQTMYAYSAGLNPYAQQTWNPNLPQTIRGGRHTLALVLDAAQVMEEMDEDDNIYGEQWVWGPLLLTLDAALTRSAPPDRSGGWTQITSGEALWFNCDGLRLPGGGGWWKAVAVMPGSASDVDVRLHELEPGTKDGFTANLAYSAWGTGLSDYVLANFNVTGWREFDVGVLRFTGAQNYTLDAVPSLTLGFDGDDTYGPWTMEANRLLHLREFNLPAGEIAIRLDNLAGTVDWGLTLHPATEPFQTKSTMVPGGQAWLNGDGQDEWMTVTVPANGWYCVAIWKARAADATKSGMYRLRIKSGVTGVPGGETPAATALVGIYPNPFNPQTRVVFDLTSARPVRLEIYDLHGGRVRTLVDGERPAGRHEAVWDGRDERGQLVASGAYVARLVAGEVRELRKLTLLK